MSTNSTSDAEMISALAYLSSSFERVYASKFGSQHAAVRGTAAYDFQVDFCYLTNEIERGPVALRPTYISQAKTLITKMRQYEEETTEGG